MAIRYRKEHRDLFGLDGTEYREECDVGNGAWVLIKCTIPVPEYDRPQVYGIYWAIPAEDEAGRQKVRVYTPHEVCLLNWEYVVISEERLQEYTKLGWFLYDFSVDKAEPLNMELLTQGRELCEEEREVIWALMLDGLSEQQACEEYFYSHHTDIENKGCCYLPTPEILAELTAVFGEHGYSC